MTFPPAVCATVLSDKLAAEHLTYLFSILSFHHFAAFKKTFYFHSTSCYKGCCVEVKVCNFLQLFHSASAVTPSVLWSIIINVEVSQLIFILGYSCMSPWLYIQYMKILFKRPGHAYIPLQSNHPSFSQGPAPVFLLNLHLVKCRRASKEALLEEYEQDGDNKMK